MYLLPIFTKKQLNLIKNSYFLQKTLKNMIIWSFFIHFGKCRKLARFKHVLQAFCCMVASIWRLFQCFGTLYVNNLQRSSKNLINSSFFLVFLSFQVILPNSQHFLEILTIPLKISIPCDILENNSFNIKFTYSCIQCTFLKISEIRCGDGSLREWHYSQGKFVEATWQQERYAVNVICSI